MPSRVLLRRVERARTPEGVPDEVDADEPPQLDDRLGVVVDPELADAVDPLTLLRRGSETLDHDRRRLLTARVASRRLPGLEGGDEPLGERAAGRQERPLHLVHDRLAGEDVPLHGVARPGAVAGPGVAPRAGVRRRRAVGGDDAELPRLARRRRRRAPRSIAASGPSCSCSSRSRIRGPRPRRPAACVATAPTPALAHGTTFPTAKYFDWTAQPTSPVASSAATIENVAFEGPRAWAAP